MIEDLYGLTTANSDEARILVEASCAIELEGHDSSYLGEYYLYRETISGKVTGLELVIFENVDPMWRDGDPPEEQWLEQEFSQFLTLIRLSHELESSWHERLLKDVPGLIHLRRKQA